MKEEIPIDSTIEPNPVRSSSSPSQPSTSVTERRMAMIFNEWSRQYAESPEDFSNVLDAEGKPIEGYGEQATHIFMKIAEEMDAKHLLPKY